MNPIDGGTLTSIPGIEVGHWSDTEALTGCTVIKLPVPNAIAGETRGAAPGTRETALLAPGMAVEQADAIVLAGGSAFGLAAADGVMRELEAAGRGIPTPAGAIPIVPAAVVYDLLTGDPSVRPDAEAGVSAFRSATSDPVAQGAIGVGAGATVAKWRGLFLPSGIGSAAVEVDGATVAAFVVVNAIGDVFSLEGNPLTGGPHAPGPIEIPVPVGENTTLAVVATDARASRSELTRLAVRAQDAFSACLRPAHTRFDGDTCFAVACGEMEVLVDNLAEGAFHAVGLAIESAVQPV
ncbi:MAG: P1 family peptidase [Actinomycetota bacterium]|nr:P1 family peptidase [Actinomycetota bacterium]